MEPHLVLKDEDDLELKSPSTKIPTLSAFVIPNKILSTYEDSFPVIQNMVDVYRMSLTFLYFQN